MMPLRGINRLILGVVLATAAALHSGLQCSAQTVNVSNVPASSSFVASFNITHGIWQQPGSQTLSNGTALVPNLNEAVLSQSGVFSSCSASANTVVRSGASSLFAGPVQYDGSDLIQYPKDAASSGGAAFANYATVASAAGAFVAADVKRSLFDIARASSGQHTVVFGMRATVADRLVVYCLADLVSSSTSAAASTACDSGINEVLGYSAPQSVVNRHAVYTAVVADGASQAIVLLTGVAGAARTVRWNQPGLFDGRFHLVAITVRIEAEFRDAQIFADGDTSYSDRTFLKCVPNDGVAPMQIDGPEAGATAAVVSAATTTVFAGGVFIAGLSIATGIVRNATAAAPAVYNLQFHGEVLPHQLILDLGAPWMRKFLAGNSTFDYVYGSLLLVFFLYVLVDILRQYYTEIVVGVHDTITSVEADNAAPVGKLLDVLGAGDGDDSDADGNMEDRQQEDDAPLLAAREPRSSNGADAADDGAAAASQADARRKRRDPAAALKIKSKSDATNRIGATAGDAAGQLQRAGTNMVQVRASAAQSSSAATGSTSMSFSEQLLQSVKAVKNFAMSVPIIAESVQTVDLFVQSISFPDAFTAPFKWVFFIVAIDFNLPEFNSPPWLSLLLLGVVGALSIIAFVAFNRRDSRLFHESVDRYAIGIKTYERLVAAYIAAEAELPDRPDGLTEKELAYVADPFAAQREAPDAAKALVADESRPVEVRAFLQMCEDQTQAAELLVRHRRSDWTAEDVQSMMPTVFKNPHRARSLAARLSSLPQNAVEATVQRFAVENHVHGGLFEAASTVAAGLASCWRGIGVQLAVRIYAGVVITTEQADGLAAELRTLVADLIEAKRDNKDPAVERFVNEFGHEFKKGLRTMTRVARDAVGVPAAAKDHGESDAKNHDKNDDHELFDFQAGDAIGPGVVSQLRLLSNAAAMPEPEVFPAPYFDLALTAHRKGAPADAEDATMFEDREAPIPWRSLVLSTEAPAWAALESHARAAFDKQAFHGASFQVPAVVARVAIPRVTHDGLINSEDARASVPDVDTLVRLESLRFRSFRNAARDDSDSDAEEQPRQKFVVSARVVSSFSEGEQLSRDEVASLVDEAEEKKDTDASARRISDGSGGGDSAVAGTNVNFRVDITWPSPLRCPLHGRHVHTATPAHYRVLRIDGTKAFVCAQRDAHGYKESRVGAGSCSGDALYVCPDPHCGYAVCSHCADPHMFTGATISIAVLDQVYAFLADPAATVCLIGFVGLQSVFVPAARHGLMLLACHPTVRCLYPGCYDRIGENSDFIAGVTLSSALLLALVVIVPIWWFVMLLRRFGEIRKIIDSSSSHAQWQFFLDLDTTVLSNLYRKYELRWMMLDPLLLFLQKGLLVIVIAFAPAGSATQLILVAAVEVVNAVFIAATDPFIDPWLDMLTKAAMGHQMAQLAWMGFHRALTRDDPFNQTMAMLMILTFVVFLAFAVYVVAKTALIPYFGWVRVETGNEFERREKAILETEEIRRRRVHLMRGVLADKEKEYGGAHFQICTTLANLVHDTKEDYLDWKAAADREYAAEVKRRLMEHRHKTHPRRKSSVKLPPPGADDEPGPEHTPTEQHADAGPMAPPPDDAEQPPAGDVHSVGSSSVNGDVRPQAGAAEDARDEGGDDLEHEDEEMPLDHPTLAEDPVAAAALAVENQPPSGSSHKAQSAASLEKAAREHVHLKARLRRTLLSILQAEDVDEEIACPHGFGYRPLGQLPQQTMNGITEAITDAAHDVVAALKPLLALSQAEPRYTTTSSNAFTLLARLGFTFRGVNLRGARLAQCHIADGTLEGTDFRDADLRHATFRNTFLKGVRFDGCTTYGSAFGDPAPPTTEALFDFNLSAKAASTDADADANCTDAAPANTDAEQGGSTHVAYAASASVLVTSSGPVVTLYHAHSGENLGTVPIPGGSPIAAMESNHADGTVIAAVGNSVAVIDATKRAVASHRQLDGVTGTLTAISLDPSGTYVAVGTADGVVAVFNQTDDLKPFWKTTLARDTKLEAALVDTGTAAAAEAFNRTLEAQMDEPLRVSVVAWSPRGDLVGVGCENAPMLVELDGGDGELVRSIDVGGRGRCDIFAPSSTLLQNHTGEASSVYTGLDKDAMVALAVKKEVFATGSYCLAYSPSSDAIAVTVVAEAPTVLLLDAASGTPIHRLVGHVATPRVVTFSPSGLWVFTGADDATIRAWETHTGICTDVITHREASGSLSQLALAPGGGRLAYGASGAAAAIIDIEHRRLTRPTPRLSVPPVIAALTWVGRPLRSPDADVPSNLYVAASNSLGRVRILDARTGRLAARFVAAPCAVRTMAILGDEALVTAADIGVVRVWGLQTIRRRYVEATVEAGGVPVTLPERHHLVSRKIRGVGNGIDSAGVRDPQRPDGAGPRFLYAATYHKADAAPGTAAVVVTGWVTRAPRGPYDSSRPKVAAMPAGFTVSGPLCSVAVKGLAAFAFATPDGVALAIPRVHGTAVALEPSTRIQCPAVKLLTTPSFARADAVSDVAVFPALHEGGATAFRVALGADGAAAAAASSMAEPQMEALGGSIPADAATAVELLSATRMALGQVANGTATVRIWGFDVDAGSWAEQSTAVVDCPVSHEAGSSVLVKPYVAPASKGADGCQVPEPPRLLAAGDSGRLCALRLDPVAEAARVQDIAVRAKKCWADVDQERSNKSDAGSNPHYHHQQGSGNAQRGSLVVAGCLDSRSDGAARGVFVVHGSDPSATAPAAADPAADANGDGNAPIGTVPPPPSSSSPRAAVADVDSGPSASQAKPEAGGATPHDDVTVFTVHRRTGDATVEPFIRPDGKPTSAVVWSSDAPRFFVECGFAQHEEVCAAGRFY